MIKVGGIVGVHSPYQTRVALPAAPSAAGSDSVELSAAASRGSGLRLGGKLLLATATAASVVGIMMPGAAAHVVSHHARVQQPAPVPSTVYWDDDDALMDLGKLSHASPTDASLAAFESSHPNTQAAALARLERARLRMNAGDYRSGLQLLHYPPLAQTQLADYALLMQATAAQHLGLAGEAAAHLQTLQTTYPSSRLAHLSRPQAEVMLRAKRAPEVPNFSKADPDAQLHAEAQAQFDQAWRAHTSGNFAESSHMLLEHVAKYGDRSHDNRGRAAYWAARDSERAGHADTARVLYQALQSRYDATWYGQLARQHLSAMQAPPAVSHAAADPLLARAVANLQTVILPPAHPQDRKAAERAHQLLLIGAEDWAQEELATASPESAEAALEWATILEERGSPVAALQLLRKSYPDFPQMKPEELPRRAWAVFYPLDHWSTIEKEAGAQRLDPYEVAGFIRQESVFNPHAASPARAYGLMQLLVPTASSLASKDGQHRRLNRNALFDPQLNIHLGSSYLRQLTDHFGGLENVAAAYNAGPGRAQKWQHTLPTEPDEYAESIPFDETRDYVQGVVRNRLEYDRLYDQSGHFRPHVGIAVPS